MTEETISKEVLDLLTCPVCKGKIRATSDRNHVECAACRTKYPVENGIPVIFLPNQHK